MLHVLPKYATQDECAFTLSIFFSPKHLYWQSQTSSLGFAWKEPQAKKWQAIAYFWIEKNTAISPKAASFGGFDFDENLSDGSLFCFISEALNELSKINLDSIKFTQMPLCYHQHHQRLFDMLFSILPKSIIEINQHISISQKSFVDLLSPAAKRRLKKCEKQGFKFQLNNSDLGSQFRFIEACRLIKNIPMSISVDRFISLYDTFPENFLSFSLFHQFQLVATCTAVVVIPQKVLYYFLPASLTEFNGFSPSILLIKYLYEYAQLHQFETLDLGISSVNGILNEGLFRFKKNLGAKISIKQIGTVNLKDLSFNLL